MADAVTGAQRVTLATTCVLALATGAVVQDRVTAAAARQYAATTREAVARGGRGPSIEEVMAPAIRSSVRWGAASGGVVLLAGLVVASRMRRRA